MPTERSTHLGRLRAAITGRCVLRAKDSPSQEGSGAAGDEELLGRNGVALDWLVDLRPIFLDPVCLEDLAALFWDRYAKVAPVQIAGMESAAVPLVTALVLEGHKRGIVCKGLFVRKERKTSGRGRQVEGEVMPDWQLVVVDDILNSGQSAEQVRVVLEAEGLTVNQLWSVLDYRNLNGMVWRETHGVEVESLFGLEEFGLKLSGGLSPMSHVYAPLWQYKAAKGWAFHIVPRSKPVRVPEGGGMLVYGTDDGLLHAVEAATGKMVWQHRAKGVHRKGIWSCPAYFEGRIYYGAYNGNLYCIDALSGREVWKVHVCDWIGSSPCILPKHGMLAIGLEYERPNTQGSNAVFRLSDGSKVWEAVQVKFQHGSPTYVAEKDWVVWGNADHDVSAYKAATGEVVWKVPTARSIKYPPAVNVAKDLVVAGDFDGVVYFIKLSTGKLLGTVETGNLIYGSALMMDDLVWVGSTDRCLYGIEINGLKVRHKVEVGARVFADPVRLPSLGEGVPDTVCVGTTRGRVVEVNPATGRIIGQFTLPDSVTNAVVVADAGKVVYVRGCMGELYALRRMIMPK